MFKDGTNVHYGILRQCVMNTLPNYHVLINLIVDIMHDLMLGVLKYDLRAILQHYTRCNLLSLDEFNSRIKNWNFGSGGKLKIRPILKGHLKDSGNINLTAKEVWFIVENLPFLLQGLVPKDDEYFNFVLIMHDLLDICLQPSFASVELNKLNVLIAAHHKFYRELLNCYLTPKFHFMLHYEEVIKRCGPLKDLMCMRLESKHQELKSYSSVCHNRRNILVSIANKQSFRFADTILSFDSTTLHNYVSSVNKINPNLFSDTVLGAVKCFLNQNNKKIENFICAEKIVFKGTVYVKNEYLIINDESAALINGIVLSGSDVIIIYCYVPIYFEKTLRSYGVVKGNDSIMLYNFIETFEFAPVPSHIYGDASFIKKLKRH